MSDNDKTTDLEIHQIVLSMAKPHGSVFVMYHNSPSMVSITQVQDVWATAWRRAGYEPPALLQLPSDMRLESLTGDQLQKAGLMRIPEHLD